MGFELVAQGHECVYPGDDAVLLGERGEGDFEFLNFAKPEIRYANTLSASMSLTEGHRRVEESLNIMFIYKVV